MVFCTVPGKKQASVCCVLLPQTGSQPEPLSLLPPSPESGEHTILMEFSRCLYFAAAAAAECHLSFLSTFPPLWCVCGCVCTCGLVHHGVCLEVRGLPFRVGSVFNHLGPMNQTEVVGPGRKHPYLMSHQACPCPVAILLIKV